MVVRPDGVGSTNSEPVHGRVVERRDRDLTGDRGGGDAADRLGGGHLARRQWRHPVEDVSASLVEGDHRLSPAGSRRARSRSPMTAATRSSIVCIRCRPRESSSSTPAQRDHRVDEAETGRRARSRPRGARGRPRAHRHGPLHLGSARSAPPRSVAGPPRPGSGWRSSRGRSPRHHGRRAGSRGRQRHHRRRTAGCRPASRHGRTVCGEAARRRISHSMWPPNSDPISTTESGTTRPSTALAHPSAKRSGRTIGYSGSSIGIIASRDPISSSLPHHKAWSRAIASTAVMASSTGDPLELIDRPAGRRGLP